MTYLARARARLAAWHTLGQARARARLTAAWHKLGEPVVLTRRFVLGFALALGLLAGAGIVLGGMAVERVADERQARGDLRREQLRRDLEREVAIARTDARVARLESPTESDLEHALARAIELLDQRPALRRRLAHDVAQELELPVRMPSEPPASADPHRRGSDRTSTSPPGDVEAPASSSPEQAPGPATPAPGAFPPEPPPPTPAPRPPIVVTTPPLPLVLPPVCVDGLLSVNCP